MEDTYGCNLINTKRDGRQVTEFVGRYHVHILVRQGQMTFSDGKNSYTSRQGDLAICHLPPVTLRVNQITTVSIFHNFYLFFKKNGSGWLFSVSL